MYKQNVNLPPLKPSIDFEFNSPPPKLARQETAEFILGQSYISQKPDIFNQLLREMALISNSASNDIPNHVDKLIQIPEIGTMGQSLTEKE